jgi:diguanylate cyclase (GGDEF)-like protein
VGSVVTTKPSVKVLVADDSEGDRAAARDALTAAGYAVVEAVDGQQALEVFARERPDLVMLDVVMPRLTGLEACRILKAKTQASYLPVIMVSTRNSVNARVEGLRSGADDYVGKPYDAEELRARVEALLRVKRAVSEAAAAGKPIKPGDDASARGDAAFRRRLEAEFDRAERYNDPLACLRIELDQYETVAGAHGSAAADELVTGLRDIIDSSVRKIDLSHRRDDRGYLLALPNTHFPGALAVAERICRDSKRLKRPQTVGGPLTVSVGVAFFPNKDTRSLHDLLELVDLALERARGEGGAKICLYQHQGYLYAPEE